MDAVTDKTLGVPGHGAVGGKHELSEFRDMLRSVRDAVAALKKRGDSADDAVAAKPTARSGPDEGRGMVDASDATTVKDDGDCPHRCGVSEKGCRRGREQIRHDADDEGDHAEGT